jgi:hypothetical protein
VPGDEKPWKLGLILWMTGAGEAGRDWFRFEDNVTALKGQGRG